MYVQKSQGQSSDLVAYFIDVLCFNLRRHFGDITPCIQWQFLLCYCFSNMQ